MGIYERFGVNPVINVRGARTRLGGSLMEQNALDAMTEAAKENVELEELQAAASKVISRITHAEAGIVTCGASAGLTLGTAACIAGFDVSRMNRLPDTTGIPNEVIMAQHHISGYEHAIRVAGAKLVAVGVYNDTPPPSMEVPAKIRQFEAEINENTVAMAYVPRAGSRPPLEEVIALGKKYNIPVMVDAALQVPPVENLYRYIDMGADLVTISGGKGIRGPQASGLLFGRRDLIASALLQSLDMVIPSYDEWNPPPSLIPKEKLRDVPLQGIGRGMKVSKEAIVGLLVTLENIVERMPQELERLKSLLGRIAARIDGILGVDIEWTEYIAGSFSMIRIKLDEVKLGLDASQLSQKLEAGTPPILARLDAVRGGLTISSVNLNEERTEIVAQRLYEILAGN